MLESIQHAGMDTEAEAIYILDTPSLSQLYIVSFNDVLLAIGGQGATNFHLYHPESRSWVKTGDLPTERVQCASTVLPNGEVLLAGGEHTEELVEIMSFLNAQFLSPDNYY